MNEKHQPYRSHGGSLGYHHQASPADRRCIKRVAHRLFRRLTREALRAGNWDAVPYAVGVGYAD